MTNEESNNDDKSVKADGGAVESPDASDASDGRTDVEESKRSLGDLPLSRRGTLLGLSAAGATAAGPGASSATQVTSQDEQNDLDVLESGVEIEVLRMNLDSDDEVLDVSGGSGPAGDNPAGGAPAEDYDAVVDEHPTPSVEQDMIPGQRLSDFSVTDRVFTDAPIGADDDSEGGFDLGTNGIVQSPGFPDGAIQPFVNEFVPYGHAASTGTAADGREYKADDSGVRSNDDGLTGSPDDRGTPQACPPGLFCEPGSELTDFATDLSSVINPQLSVKVDSIGVGQDSVSTGNLSPPITAADLEDQVGNVGNLSSASNQAVLVDADGNVPDLHSSDANGYTVAWDGSTIVVEFEEHRTDVTLPNSGFITETESDTIPSLLGHPGEDYPLSASRTSGLGGPDRDRSTSSLGLQGQGIGNSQPGEFVRAEDLDLDEYPTDLFVVDREFETEPQLNGELGHLDVTSVTDVDAVDIAGKTIVRQRLPDTSEAVPVSNGDPLTSYGSDGGRTVTGGGGGDNFDSLFSAVSGYAQIPANADFSPDTGSLGFSEVRNRGDPFLIGSETDDSPGTTDAQGVLLRGRLDGDLPINQQALVPGGINVGAQNLQDQPNRDVYIQKNDDVTDDGLPDPVAEQRGVVSAGLAYRNLDFDPDTIDVEIAGDTVTSGNSPFGVEVDGIGLTQPRTTPVQVFVTAEFSGDGSQLEAERLDITEDPRVEFSITDQDGDPVQTTIDDSGVITPDTDDDNRALDVTVSVSAIENQPVARGTGCPDDERIESADIGILNGSDGSFEDSPAFADGRPGRNHPTGVPLGDQSGSGDSPYPVGEQVHVRPTIRTSHTELTGPTQVDITEVDAQVGSTNVSFAGNDTGIAEIDSRGLITVRRSRDAFDDAPNSTTEFSVDLTNPDTGNSLNASGVSVTADPVYFIEVVGEADAEIYDLDEGIDGLREVSFVDRSPDADPGETGNKAVVDDVVLDDPQTIAAELEDAINNATRDGASVTVVYNPSPHSATGYVVLSDSHVNSSFDQNVDQSSVEIQSFDLLIQETVIDPSDFDSQVGPANLAELDEMERQNVACALGFDVSDEQEGLNNFNQLNAAVIFNGLTDFLGDHFHAYEPRSDPLNEVIYNDQPGHYEVLGDNQLTCTLDGTVNRTETGELEVGANFGDALNLLGDEAVDDLLSGSIPADSRDPDVGTQPLLFDDSPSFFNDIFETIVYHQSEDIPEAVNGGFAATLDPAPDGEADLSTFTSAADNANDNKAAVHTDSLTRYNSPVFIEAFEIVEEKDTVALADFDDPTTPSTQVRDDHINRSEKDQRLLDEDAGDTISGFPQDERGGTIVDTFYGDRFDGVAVANADQAGGETFNAADITNMRDHQLLADPDNERDFIATDQRVGVQGSYREVQFPSDRKDVVAFLGGTNLNQITNPPGGALLGSFGDPFIFTDTRGNEIYFGTDSETTCGISVDDDITMAVTATPGTDTADGETLRYVVPELVDQNYNGIANGEYFTAEGAVVTGTRNRINARDQDSGLFFESHDDQGNIVSQTTFTIGEPLPEGPIGGGGEGPEDYDPTGSTDVSNTGLVTAISDWRNNDIETSALLDIIDAWRQTS